jgi:hypothetical protein
VEVNNSGQTSLHNVYIQIEGISQDWIEISPEKIDLIVSGNSTDFSIKVAVPINAKSGNYPTNVKTIANETSVEESFIVRVFASRTELILYQLQTLKDKIKDLEEKTLEAEIQNKDVTLVKDILDRARERITIAEGYLDKKMYDETTNLIRNIRDLLDEAEYELKVAKLISAPPTLRYWILGITGALIGISVVILYVLRKIRAFEKPRIPMPEIRTELKKLVLGRETLDKLEKEREKIEKMLVLIENEYKQGIISEESYRELKKKNEEKIKEIEEKMGRLK